MSEATGAAPQGGNAGGEGAPAETSWTTGMNEDTLAYVEARGWKDSGSVVESYRNLERFSGGAKNLVALPGDDADDATMDAFYSKMGRPESADKYSFKSVDGADKDLEGWFRDTMFQLGINDKAVSRIYDAWTQMAERRMNAFNEAARVESERQLDALKREWGGEFDQKVTAGKRVVEGFGYDENRMAQLEEKLGTTEFFRLMVDIGSKMGEAELTTGDRSGAGFGLSPAQAKQEIADLRMDKSFMDRYLSGDKDAFAKMTRLTELAFGG